MQYFACHYQDLCKGFLHQSLHRNALVHLMLFLRHLHCPVLQWRPLGEHAHVVVSTHSLRVLLGSLLGTSICFVPSTIHLVLDLGYLDLTDSHFSILEPDSEPWEYVYVRHLVLVAYVLVCLLCSEMGTSEGVDFLHVSWWIIQLAHKFLGFWHDLGFWQVCYPY